MEHIIIFLVAFIASGLTLFAGFGLGTILLPVFTLFFSIDLAIAMTAIVHLLNNIFKLILLGKYANLKVVARFGIPAILAAFLGAWVLLRVSTFPILASYEIAGHEFRIMPVKLTVALLMIFFALFEIIPNLKKISLPHKFLPVGGLLSGFFGGLSGHQGALRSVFLLQCGLSKESFIGTGVAIACIIDVSRIFVYSSRFTAEFTQESVVLLIIAILAGFSGAFIGNKLLKKVTLYSVQTLVAVMLFGIAFGLALGLF